MEAAEQATAVFSTDWSSPGGHTRLSLIYLPLRAQQATIEVGLHRHTGLLRRNFLILRAFLDDARQPPVTIHWGQDASVEDTFVALDVKFRQALGAAAPQLTPVSVFAALARTLDVALRRSAVAGAAAAQQPKLIEIPTEHWLITTQGLEHRDAPANAFDMSVITEAGAQFPQRLGADAPDPHELPHAWATAHARFTQDSPSLVEQRRSND